MNIRALSSSVACPGLIETRVVFECKAIIDGKEQNVEITIFTDVNGNKYYNHVLPEEENKKRSLSVYPVQAPERNGIPAIRQQASSTNSISNRINRNNSCIYKKTY